MDRRQFIQFAAAGAAGIVLSGAVWLPSAEPPLSVLGRPALLRLLNSPDEITAIGKAFHAEHPTERTANAIASAILTDAQLSSNLPEPAMREALSRQIRQDFADHRTVRLRGWILSVTEARQCALYSILSPSLS